MGFLDKRTERRTTVKGEAMVDPHEERMIQIDVWNTVAADFPDGAFMAFMEEKGVDVSELYDYAQWRKKKEG